MTVPNFTEMKFQNRAPQTLRQIYAVLYFLKKGYKHRAAINEATKYFPKVKDTQTIEDKCARRFAGYIGIFVEWYKWNKIIPNLIKQYKLNKHDEEIFRSLLEPPTPVDNGSGKEKAYEHSPQAVGAGFGNHDDNKEVETAAISFVSNLYKLKGWYVESVENEKCGFDLLCTQHEEIENIEVKGIKGKEIGFIITRGELEQAKQNSNFVLYAVTQALSSPQPHRFNGPAVLSNFDLVELQYRATYKKL